MCQRESHRCPICKGEYMHRFNRCLAALRATPGEYDESSCGSVRGAIMLGPLPNGQICNQCRGIGPVIIPIPQRPGAYHRLVKVPARNSPSGKESYKVIELTWCEETEALVKIKNDEMEKARRDKKVADPAAAGK